MAKKFYGINDKWTDENADNDIMITSDDGTISEVTVNGTPYGGGEAPAVTFKVINNTGKKVYMYGACESWGIVDIRTDITVGFNGNVTLITSSTGETNCFFDPQNTSNPITTSASGSADTNQYNNGYRVYGSDAVITITAV